MKSNYFTVLILCLCLVIGRTQDQAEGFEQTINNFSYQQQQYWNGIWNKCNGKLQSPIEITTFQTSHDLKFSLSFEDKSRHYKFSPEHSLKILYPYSVIELTMPNQSMDSVYQSVSISFKSPGEHSIEGLRGSLELIIHYRRIHGEQGNPLLILAIPIVSDETAATDIFANELRITTSSMEESKKISFKEILANIKTGEFFIYNGSLAQPPCSEIVTWIIS